MTPSDGLEDHTGSGDLFFLERPASVDIARNIAGAPGREARQHLRAGRQLSRLAVLYRQEDHGRHLDRRIVGTFDAQQALVGRAAWLAVSAHRT